MRYTRVIAQTTLIVLMTLGISSAQPCSEKAAQIVAGDTTSNGAYNVACCFSLEGRIDEALFWLQAAIRHGYHNVDWMTRDGDLSPLHAEARWSATVDACEAAEREYLATINTELYGLFQADQAERTTGDIGWDSVTVHDAMRRDRVREMIADSVLHACDDYIHAAFIFQHGVAPEDYALAHELALTAVALDSTSSLARWIAAASKDRYLVNVGRPQWYGTQFNLRDGRWTIDPIDTINITDEDRAYWSVPTLQQAREREAEMNGER